MVAVGIVLLVIGALIAVLSPDPSIKKLGYVAAVIGLVIVVLALLLETLDEADKDGELGALFTLPLLALRAKLR